MKSNFTQLLLVALFLTGTASCSPERVDTHVSLEGNWDYVWGRDMEKANSIEGVQDWGSFSFPGMPPHRDNDRFLLVRSFLPKSINRYRDPGMFIYIALEDFEVYVAGEKVYSFGDLNNPQKRVESYIFPHMIPLTLDSAGKEIRILFHSSYHQFIGADHSVYVDNLANINQTILINDYPRYLLGAVYLLLAVISILWYFVIVKNRLFLYYALLVLLNSIITVTANYFAMNFFNNPSVPPIIFNISQYFLPVAFFAFTGELFKNTHPKVFRFGTWFYAGTAIIYLLLIALDVSSFINMEIIFEIFLIPGVLFLIYAIGKNAIHGDIDSRLLFTGFCILSAFTFHDILRDLEFIPGSLVLYWYGIFIFLIFQGSLLFRRIYSIQKSFELKNTELLVAKKIQNSILPIVPPKIGNWELESIFEPMKEVGGDFFDIIIDEEGNIGVLILDVSGHGVGAALIASMAKVAFSHCLPFISQPEEVMREMNQSLKGKMNGNFATAFYLYIPANDSLVKFSSAGHPSGLLASHLNNEAREFRTKSKPLGILTIDTFPSSYLYLNEGDLICIYTDGVTELINPGMEEYGEERLKDLLLKNCLYPLEEIKENIILELKNWTKYPSLAKEDDLTLLLLRFSGLK
jgi:serine phosphatase RsbU (regulator of sigma subunit)